MTYRRLEVLTIYNVVVNTMQYLYIYSTANLIHSVIHFTNRSFVLSKNDLYLYGVNYLLVIKFDTSILWCFATGEYCPQKAFRHFGLKLDTDRLARILIHV